MWYDLGTLQSAAKIVHRSGRCRLNVTLIRLSLPIKAFGSFPLRRDWMETRYLELVADVTKDLWPKIVQRDGIAQFITSHNDILVRSFDAVI